MATTTTQLEERVAVLEAEVAQLKRNTHAPPSPRERWWEAITGTFANDELFEEAMRFGQEYRVSQKADE